MKPYKYNIQDRFNKALAYIVRKTSGAINIQVKVDLNIELELTKILKKNNFVENIDGWHKGFVTIILKKDGVFILHNINNNKQINLTRVENPLVSIEQWISYFEKK